jgi:hypothetical protein
MEAVVRGGGGKRARFAEEFPVDDGAQQRARIGSSSKQQQRWAPGWVLQR